MDRQTGGAAAVTKGKAEIFPIKPITAQAKAALDSGRLLFVGVQTGQMELMAATIYGWTGGTDNTEQASRTDDLLAIVRNEFLHQPAGPKLIGGDLNATQHELATFGVDATRGSMG